MCKNRRDAAIIEFVIIMLISDMIIFVEQDFFINISIHYGVDFPFHYLALVFLTIWQFIINMLSGFYFYKVFGILFLMFLCYFIVFIVIANLVSLLGISALIRRMMSTKLLTEENAKPSIKTRLIRTNIKWTMLYFWPVVSLGYICNKSNPFYNKETDQTIWDRICKTKVVDVTVKNTNTDSCNNENLNRSMIDATVLEFISMIILIHIMKMYLSISFINSYSLWINILINYILYTFIAILLTIPMVLSRYTNLVYYGFHQKITTLQGEKPKTMGLIARSVIKWSMLLYYPLIWLAGKIIGRNLFIDEDTGLTYWDIKSKTKVVEIEE